MKQLLNGKGKWLSIFLTLFLVFDVAFTFHQQLQLPLDGDLVPIVLPSEHYSEILDHPFGLHAITHQKEYAATSRYFAHLSMVLYFKNLHQFITPIFKNKIHQLYVMAASYNTFVHLLILFLLSVYVCGHAQFWRRSFIIAAAIVAPFLQIVGYYDSIGIIDVAVTYTFFYAFSVAILLLYFLPFYLSWRNKKTLSYYFKPILWLPWLGMTVYLTLSGSIIPPIILIGLPILYFSIIRIQVSSIISLDTFWRSIKNIPNAFIFFTTLLYLMSLYSFYVSTYNIEGSEPVSLLFRYKALAKGMPVFLTQKPTFFFMAALLLVNGFVFQRYLSATKKKLLKQIFLLAAFFCCLYILFLPLGGYRSYRPLIVRYDTFLPITILLILSVSFSSYYIIIHLLSYKRKLYLAIVVVVLGIFSIADYTGKPYWNNTCQKSALESISSSNEKVVPIEEDCFILSWNLLPNPNYTKDIGDMLYFWGITNEPKLFYQVEE